jgi:alpha-1,3-rhamnosyl/mannosyltransferase
MGIVKAGIDVTPLRSVRTGVGHYLANLLTGLQALPSLELSYFTGERWLASLTEDPPALARRSLPVRLVSRSLGWLGPAGMLARDLFNRHYLRRHLAAFARDHLDLVHGMHYQVYDLPVPEIITVFDISCFRHPGTHPPGRVAFQRKYLPRALERAAHIITISEFSRAEIVDCFGVAPGRITVTLCAAAEVFRPRTPQELAPALTPFGLVPGGYLLTVGTLEPRKNLVTLLRAHDTLPAPLRRRFPLAIAGMQGWKTGRFRGELDAAVAAGSVRVLGYVPDETLPSLYAGAAAFAYPSLYEGFGLPPLEALASAVPAAVSDASSLPEVVGDAALRVPPLDVVGWRDALQRLLEDDVLRTRLRAAGPERARRFSWSRTALQTADVYRNVAGR